MLNGDWQKKNVWKIYKINLCGFDVENLKIILDFIKLLSSFISNQHFYDFEISLNSQIFYAHATAMDNIKPYYSIPV